MKKYRLPKDFAEEWLAALRSGKYTQTSAYLLTDLKSVEEDADLTNLNTKNCAFCCLGVAASLNTPLEVIYNLELPYTGLGLNIPQELEIKDSIGNTAKENPLPYMLYWLNDGFPASTFSNKQGLLADLPGEFIFRKDPAEFFHQFPNGSYKLTFPEIADFIEDNVDFY